MAYFLVADFRSGLDLRRPALVAPPGTLRKLKNAHLTAGGDIEKRYAFGKIYDLPPGTFGIAGLGNTLYTFSASTSAKAAQKSAPITFSFSPSPWAALTVTVVTVALPAGKTASHLEDWDIFDGKLYAVIAATDGTYHHFYDGTLVPDPVTRNIKTFKSKMYGIGGQTLQFSAIDDPTIVDPAAPDPATGAGFITLGNIDGESGELVGLEVYYDQLAVMSRYATQIWEVDPDPALNNLRQTLRNAGTIAPRSVKQYGSGDILFLHDSGIRSLKAKDSSNSAAVSDIGSPIDPEIQRIINTRPNDEYITDAFSLIEPNTGRFWLCFKDRIFILSYFPGPKVSAWSEYDPGFDIAGGVVARGQVVLRTGDSLYAYGGTTGVEYDSCKVEIETPYLDVDKPATLKQFSGIDIAAWGGDWSVEASYDINAPEARDQTARLNEPSYDGGSIALQGTSSHVSLTLTNEAPGPAMLSAIAVHYVGKGKSD